MRLLLALLLLVAVGDAQAQRNDRGRPNATARQYQAAQDQMRHPVSDIETEQRALVRAARRAAARGYDADDVLNAYERDRTGAWYRRGEIIITSADATVFADAAARGLRVRRRAQLRSAGVEIVAYLAPADANVHATLNALRASHPDAAIDLNFLYAAQGEAAPAAMSAPAPPQIESATVAIIDGPLPDLSPPSTTIAKRRFVTGAPANADHAARVSAILARSTRARSLRLLAADVVSAGPIEGAAADDIARALDWAALEGAGVINVSLTGPPSMTLTLLVRALAVRGSIIVAAAGNDGPRAPAPHPAAAPGAIGVTAIDARGRVWRRATRGDHVDFAALGVNVAVDGADAVTGTSYATPVVAGLLAQHLPAQDPVRAIQARLELETTARDLGAPGRDRVFGFGVLEAP